MRSFVTRLSIVLATCLVQCVNATSTIPDWLELDVVNHLEILASEKMAGRRTGSFGSKLAQNYIIEKLRQSGLSPVSHQFKQQFSYKHLNEIKHGVNIAAIKRSNVQNAPYIILSAHYDHLGIKHHKVFYGADDNASGVSILLVLAKAFANVNTKHHLIFLFTDAEEHGLKGATEFTKQNQNILAHTQLNINFDMLAGSRWVKRLHVLDYKLKELISPNEQKSFYKQGKRKKFKIIRGFKKGGNFYNRGIPWKKSSDHYVFAKLGIPYIYYGSGMHAQYHTEHDQFSRINLALFTANTKTIYQQVNFLFSVL